MSERTMEARSESGVQGVPPQSEGVKDLTLQEIIALPNEKFEERLDDIFGEKRPESDLGEITRPTEQVKQKPERSENSLGKRLIAAATVGALLGGAGVALSPTEAKATTGILQTKLESKIPTPAPNQEPVLPTPTSEDAEYMATIKALESLGYSTEHYAERQKKIDEYKQQLIEYAGENVNLEICANVIYGIKDAIQIDDQSYVHSEKAIVGNYATVAEVFEFYKDGKFRKNSNLRAVYYNDENGNPTKEAGLISVVNPKIKTMSVDAIGDVISELERIFPWFLRGLNSNNVFMIFQSDAGGSQGVKYNDVEIYFNYSDKGTDTLRGALPVEQFGVRCKALGGEFSNRMMDALLKPRFAALCCKNILPIVDRQYYDFVNYLCTRYQQETVNYTEGYLLDRTLNYVDNLMAEAKLKNLFTPYGAETWAEIDAVVNAENNSVTAKADEEKTN